MRPYNPNNLDLQPFPHWRVLALAWAGKLLGVQFHVGGIPFGAPYDPAMHTPLKSSFRGKGA